MSVELRSDPYDVVIVGAGFVGSILAKELAESGADVLILEAGTDQARTFAGYQQQLETYRGALYKTPESPYEFNPNAPEPDPPGVPTPAGKYFVEVGDQPFRSTYARTAGGTTLHWLGTCLRMLPEDFAMKSTFGQGLDWPIGYQDLVSDYALAEEEIGVSADAGEQDYLGITFPSGYSYPMQPIPSSWLDQQIAAAVDGLSVGYGGVSRALSVRNTPVGRNSNPNGNYKPVGGVDRGPDWGDTEKGQDLVHDIGQRCQGNTACVPICPVQAKYNALKTLTKATRTGRVTVLTQAVAARVLAKGRQVTGVEFLRYPSPDSPAHKVEVARGRTYVVACHAVENAKLLLNSKVPDPSELLGRCLMDHPTTITWGLMPQPVGAFRGPISTSGIEDFRGGPFRAEQAAFRLEIGNEGWLWPMGAPKTTVSEAVHKGELFGDDLRSKVGNTLSRQFRFGMLVESLPDAANSVSIDPSKRDAIGLPRPVIRYSNFDEYTLKAIAGAHEVAEVIFKVLGVEDHTAESDLLATVEYEGRKYPWDGAGHYAGTHLMGDSEENSVVDSNQRFWAYDNLHVPGPGSMPTMGTANPSLTVAALTYRTARDIVKALEERDGRHA